MQELTLQIETKNLLIDKPVVLEGGDVLPRVTIRYTTYGTLNANGDNCVWVFHALTGNSNPLEWWGGIIGSDGIFDPEKDFIVCANVLGSCYGTTGPEDFSFPFITISDMVKVHQLLRDHLNVKQIKVGIGGSLGGQQLLEWAIQEPDFFQKIIPIATNAVHSPWGIAFNEAQRMALENPNLEKGLEAARAIAMLSYRHYNTFENAQKDQDQRWDHFSASSYLNHQGKKLRNRFTPFAYYTLSKAMDSHNVGRHYFSVESALSRVSAETLVIGIDSDVLFPISEQELLVKHIENAELKILQSQYGHDAFLIESEILKTFIKPFIL